ncbi:asparagine synthetase B, partial [Candidatus Peregrinibacteria bacterium]|nr:asparagine synthetase B [Candidatus Peregrinibacteria bacterium]
MNRLQAYRGPDEEGIFRFRKDGEGTAAALSLGNTRLAIIDLKEGRQPMSTKDGRYTIVFNGEIFNAPELRSEYEAQGAAFMTDHSDTEVVLQGYALEGARAVKRLNGMFAFAIFDRKTGDLFCARDQMGIKPLYYAAQDGRVAFASELKSLLLLPFIKRQLNIQSFSHFMSLQYVPGEETIFEGIKRLPAG